MANRKRVRAINKQNEFTSDLLEKVKKNPAGLLLIVIVLVVISFLVFNFITTRRTTEITTQDQEEQEITLPTTHTVERGETLGTISEKYYGTKDHWKLIAETNNLANPDIIHSDNQLTIPKLKGEPSETQTKQITSQAEENDQEEVEESSSQTYVIQRGDTLWIIAEKFYNDGFQWRKIYDANSGIGRLPNGNILIHADNTLKIPK